MGKVQGVGFRAFTVRVATRRDLVGGVRNMDDGHVELEAEGPNNRILLFIEDLKVGPSASRVKSVQVEWLSATGREACFDVWY